MQACFNLIALTLAAPSLAVAQQATLKAKDKPATCAEVLAAIAEVDAAGEIQPFYLETFLWKQSVGYAVYSLTPRTDAGEEGYALQVESVVQMPRSSRIATQTTATLTSSFEPLDVEVIRSTVSPDGTKQRTRESAQIDGDVISLEQQIDDGPVYGNTVATPERPFLIGIEFVISRIDPRGFTRFNIREFDPRSGTVREHNFKTERHKEGGHRIWSTKRDGAISYQFVRDDTGRILSTKGGLPIEMRASTQQRVEKLRRQMGGR